MSEIVFLASSFLIFYSYFGYTISLYIVGCFKKKDVRRKSCFPNVTMIITAHNEEKRLKPKIENTLAIAYPKDRLQILIASDGSTDGTNGIAERYQDSGVELLAIPVRGGKENAQKEALKSAKGDVIVFTDVATMVEPLGLERIVSNFADSTVGCVSSEDRFIGREGGTSGEGFYVRYEMLIRRLESKVYFVLFLGQVSFYCVALWVVKRNHASGSLIRIPYYFLTVNASIFIAWWRYLRRQRVVMWTPSER